MTENPDADDGLQSLRFGKLPTKTLRFHEIKKMKKSRSRVKKLHSYTQKPLSCILTAPLLKKI
ncbi:MAG: hypothetical protein ACOYOA_15230 [Saprospiraceae bacterium]